MSCRHKLDFEAVVALVGSRLLEKAGEGNLMRRSD